MDKTALATSRSTLREQVFALSHQWYLPVLAFLIGSLAGWAISYLIPTPYRAQAVLSVAFNGDLIPRNPDDYKNWQLEQLNLLAVAPDVVQETLRRLQSSDSFWDQTNTEDLRAMMDVSWRNTGEWRLQVETDDPERSVQAVQTWQAVFLEQYDQAYQKATELLMLSSQVDAIIADLIEARRRYDDVIRASTALSTWQTAATQLPGDQPIDSLTFWQLWSIAARAAGYDPAWHSALDSLPELAAPTSNFLAWAENFQAILASEASLQQSKIQTLQPKGDALWLEYYTLAEAGRGVSSNLYVDSAINSYPAAEAIRPGSILALVGGVLGVVAWGFIWLARFSSKDLHA